MKNLLNKSQKGSQQISHKLQALLGTAFVFATDVAFAQTGGLSKAKGVLETFKSEVTTFVPIIAVIALTILGIGYATKFVSKETFVQWAVGIIIAGSAAQLTALFFT